MPAINKKKTATTVTLKKTKKSVTGPKTKKPKLISSQLGVTAVKKNKSKRPFNPLKANRGVVFIKHIPHGFYEEQLKAYFEQFGQVTRTRVARSKKSGKSNGYAFVEFKVPEVAKIAADTMDNYLMFKQTLKTAYLAPEEQKFNYFRNVVHTQVDADGTAHLVTPQTKRADLAIKRMNTMPTKKQHENRVERALYKLKKAQEAYGTKNIPLDLDMVAQNKSDSPEGAAKPLNKKQQKVATAAKKEAAKAAFAAKKALQADTTLERLLNETIPDGDDASDESFAPEEADDESSSDNESADQSEAEDDGAVEPAVSSKQQEKKRKIEVAFPLVPAVAKPSKAKQAKPVKPTKSAPPPKATSTKKQKLNDTPDSLNSSVSSLATSSSSASAPSSPDTPAPKKSKKQLVLAPTTPDSPVVKSKKIANAGIQKRTVKPSVTADKLAKKAKKSAAYTGASKEQLEDTAAKLCNTVSAADIKKKTKTARR